MKSSARRDALMVIVATHERKAGIRNARIHCTCGWSQSILGMISSKGAFREHLVDSLDQLVEAREQAAVQRALSDAAGAIGDDVFIAGLWVVEDWLRERAGQRQ